MLHSITYNMVTSPTSSSSDSHRISSSLNQPLINSSIAASLPPASSISSSLSTATAGNAAKKTAAHFDAPALHSSLHNISSSTTRKRMRQSLAYLPSSTPPSVCSQLAPAPALPGSSLCRLSPPISTAGLTPLEHRFMGYAGDLASLGDINQLLVLKQIDDLLFEAKMNQFNNKPFDS